MTFRKLHMIAAAAAILVLAAGSSKAQIVIDGTDAPDHGSFNGTANVNGWRYMQAVLDNVGGQVANGNKKLVVLGANSSQALSAINSAYIKSTLGGAGWTKVHINGAVDIANYFAGNTVNGVNLATTGFLNLSTRGHVGGDMTAAEMGAVNAAASQLANLVNTGAGFWSMAETGTGAYGWLSTLIPGLIGTDIGTGGVGNNITLTPDGTAAFPSLTQANLNGADPWHSYFSGNLGSLKVLGTSTTSGSNVLRNVIIGGGVGTKLAPVPEPGTIALLIGLAVPATIMVRRRK